MKLARFVERRDSFRELLERHPEPVPLGCTQAGG